MKKLLLILLIGLPFLGFGQTNNLTQQQTPSVYFNTNRGFGYQNIQVFGWFGIPIGANATLNGSADVNGLIYAQTSDSTLRIRYNHSWLPFGGSGGGSSSTYFSASYFGGLGTAVSPLTVVNSDSLNHHYSDYFVNRVTGQTIAGTNIFSGILRANNAPASSTDVMRAGDTATFVVGKLPNGDVYIDGKLYPVKGFISDSASVVTSNSTVTALTLNQATSPYLALQVNGGSNFNGQAEYQQYVQFDQSADFEQELTFASISGNINGKGFEWFTDPSNHWGLQYSTADSALHYSKNNAPNSGNRIALMSDITGGGGTVTSVSAGTGMSFSTITTTGSVSADTTVLQTVANFFPKGDTRYAKITSLPSAANPTASVGTSAVNGSATTYMRSDAAPKADTTALRTVANSYSLADMQTKLSSYAPLASPTFTGTPAAPTAAPGTNTTQLATTAFVTSAIPSLSGYVPYTGATSNVVLGTNSISTTTYTNATGTMSFTTNGGNTTSLINFDFPGITNSTGTVRLFRLTNTSAALGMLISRGNGTSTSQTFLGANTNSYINGSTGTVTIGSTTTAGSSLGVAGGVSIGSTSFTSAAPTDGLLVQGSASLTNTLLLSGGITQATGANNTFANITGVRFNEAAATYTDNTAATGTLAYNSANVLHQPTFSATNTGVIYTNPSTLQIDGAPVAGTNVTLTNPMAIFVGAGISAFNGGITSSSNGFNSNVDFVGNSVTATTTISNYLVGGASTMALRAGHFGSTSSTLGANNSYGGAIFASAPITTPATGTNAVLANVIIKGLGTVTSGGATVTETDALLVQGSGATIGTSNYSLRAKNGRSRIDSLESMNLYLNGAYATTGQVPIMGASQLGWGTASITQGSGDLTAQTSTGNVATFTVGSSTATFNVSAYLNVTAIATDVIQIQVTYTDENNTAQTISFSTINTVTNSSYSPVTIRAKNGTTITVKTNLTVGAGSVTFDAGGRITQL